MAPHHNPFCPGHVVHHHGGYHCYPPGCWYAVSQQQTSTRPLIYEGIPLAAQETQPATPSSPPPREAPNTAREDALADIVGKLATKVEELEKKLSEK